MAISQVNIKFLSVTPQTYTKDIDTWFVIYLQK